MLTCNHNDGTIWPDILESEEGIKAHHNAGGLPEDMNTVSHSQDRDLEFVVRELSHVIVWKQYVNLTQFFVRNLKRTDLKEKSGSILLLFRISDLQELRMENVLLSGLVSFAQYALLTL